MGAGFVVWLLYRMVNSVRMQYDCIYHSLEELRQYCKGDTVGSVRYCIYHFVESQY